MTRKNFPRAVLVACVKRATRNSNVYCEECHALAKRWQIDHINPDGLTGQPVLDNARLLCLPCHAEKTASDVAKIARAKRREADHLHIHKPSARRLQGPQFAQSRKRKQHPIKSPPRINVFTREIIQ